MSNPAELKQQIKRMLVENLMLQSTADEIGDDQLQGIHRIQAQALRSKQRLVIANLFRSDLEHEVFHQHAFDLNF